LGEGAGNINPDALVRKPCEAVMAEFLFEPPLRLERDILVRTLNQAATVARVLIVTLLPPGERDAVVRQLEAAKGTEREREAANAFCEWAAAEGLLKADEALPQPRAASQSKSAYFSNYGSIRPGDSIPSPVEQR
jgi:hypothetical protein